MDRTQERLHLKRRCGRLVEELGLAKAADIIDVVPLTGGVASDIAMIRFRDRKLCVKFALPKLKVAADWRAPVHRNAAEYAWMELASRTFPESAVKLFGRSEAAHGFAMEFLEGEDVYLWKDNLLKEMPDDGEAAKVATLLGKIHSVSARQGFRRTPFQNRDDFYALRIEPYLTHTRISHPTLADFINPFETLLYKNQSVLVHGDCSPKNIFFRESNPIVLDAECATMGDACFDPSFCMNHLVLKAVHLPASRARLLDQVTEFWKTYSALVDWEDRNALEKRVCALLPVLMLARVDGKSPVEYLSKMSQQTIRDLSFPLITSPSHSIAQFTTRIKEHFSGAIQ